MKECPACGRIFEDSVGECPDDETPLCAMGEADPLIGAMAGNYRIARRIGRGGMGAVYAAEQPAIGSEVAIKVLHRKFSADTVVVERFFNEARAVNLIGHENIVRIFDLAHLPDGTPYFVMELLRGKSLGDLCGSRHSPEELTPLFLQLAAALQATHSAGIVHRDLKPDNVFLADSADGPKVKVLDFGIAKLARPPGAKRTQTGAILGSAQYLSPEQAAGDANVGPASDIYSAGVMLFELLCGKPPFEAETYGDLLVAHRTQSAPRVRSVVPALPQPLDDFVAACLEKKPEDRPKSMNAFAATLQSPPAVTPPRSSAGRIIAITIPVAIVAAVSAIWLLIRPVPIEPAKAEAPKAKPVFYLAGDEKFHGANRPPTLPPSPDVPDAAPAAPPPKVVTAHVDRPPPEPRFTIPERVGDGMIDVEW